MAFLMKEIFLDEKLITSYKYLNNQQGKMNLNNLSRVNLLVGANNSGKSRLMREMFIQADYEFIPNEFDLEAVNTVIKNLKDEIEAVIK